MNRSVARTCGDEGEKEEGKRREREEGDRERENEERTESKGVRQRIEKRKKI